MRSVRAAERPALSWSSAARVAKIMRMVAVLVLLVFLLNCAAGLAQTESSQPSSTAASERTTSAQATQTTEDDMYSEKLDPRLLEEIRLRSQDESAREESQPFTVAIELVEDLPAPQSGSRKEKLAKMTQLAQQSQAALLAELKSMGVTEFESLALSNSISTELTLEQIERVASRDDVRRIRLRKIERVTTGISL